MTYVYEKYDYSLFAQRFENLNRVNDFGGYQGLKALYDALEQLAEDTGEPIEVDVIGLCCEFSYYDSLDQYNDDYGTDYEDISDIEEVFCIIDGDQFIVHAH